MMNIKGIFAVSLIAMVAMVAGAHTSNAVAAIASQGYVDQQVGSKLSSISGSTTGSGNVVTVVSASGSTVSATKGITAEETKNKVTSVRAASSATDTAYPSEKAVATALAGKEVVSNKVTSTNYDANVSSDTKYPTVKAVAEAIADVEEKIPAKITVDSALSSTSTNPVQNKVINTALSGKVTIAQGSGAANKAVITNSSGNIITGQIASGMIADDAVTSAKLAAGAVDANALAAGAVTSAKIADGTIPTVNNATLTIKKNGATVGTFTANASANKEIDIEVPAASDILTTTTVTSSGTGAVLTGVSVTAGKVTLQKGNVQIPSGGQNATSYVSIWVE